MTPVPMPAGFRLIPLAEESSIWVWRLAVVVKEREGGSEELVLLAGSPDMRVYLGAVVDGRGLPREWIEIWVQNLIGLGRSGSEVGLTNDRLDARWKDHWQWLVETIPQRMLLSPEAIPSRPIYINLEAGCAVVPRLEEGRNWELCRDDSALQAAGLESYAGTTTRYLWATPSGRQTPIFLGTDPESPAGTSMGQAGPEVGFGTDWLPLNPQGGQMAIRSHAFLTFDDYVDMLNGATVDEIKERKPGCVGDSLAASLAPEGAGGWRLPTVAPRAPALEVFHLKLRLLRQAAAAVDSWLRRNRTPLLNLDPASFDVDVSGGDGLPWPWTTKCSLSRPGRAMAYAIPGSDVTQFVPFGRPGLPDFCLEGLGETVDEETTIRLLTIAADTEERLTIEGHLTTKALVRSSDHVRLRLRVPGLDDLTFFGRVTGSSSAEGGVSFTTWPRGYATAQAERLRREVGRRIVRCWCAIRPVLSSPYDFYSLSVLGLRTLVANANNPLTALVGDLEDLGRAAGREFKEKAAIGKLGIAVESLLAAKGAWPRLQPIQVVGGARTDAIPNPPFPPRLWAEALAVLLHLTPGLGTVSQCEDYGAAPHDALQAPLAEPLAALESLAARTRSLLFDDWAANREARAILARLRTSG